MKPLVSVVVPVRNREKLIGRCLDSISRQTYDNIELIVVDNGSTDRTLAAATELKERYQTLARSPFKEIKILTENSEGACPARRKGLENVTGEYVVFFDSDDAMRPELIETAIKAVEKNPDPDVVCWRCNIVQIDGRERVPSMIARNPLESHLVHGLFRPQGTMFKTEFIRGIGGWKNNLPVWNDFELGLRILLNTTNITLLDDILADIYAQRESITGLSFTAKAGSWEKTLEVMREENARSCHPEKNRIEDILTYREVILAALYSREGNKEAGRGLYLSATNKKKRLQRLLLQFSYHYTRKGGRGAWRIIRRLYQ